MSIKADVLYDHAETESASDLDALPSTSGWRKGRRFAGIAASVLAGTALLMCGLARAGVGPSLDGASVAIITRLEEVLATPEEDCDFMIFTHVPDPKKLDEFTAFPLNDLVTDAEGKQGILVMYVMPAKEWGDMLAYIHQLTSTKNDTAPAALVELNKTCYEKMAIHNTDTIHRIRMVSPLDFKETLLSIRHRLGHDMFQKWFGHTTYDAPKIVGSIMRIRTLGNSVPVFRFDIDIICSRVSKEDNMKSIKHAVSSAVDDFNAAVADIHVTSFVLSQQYYGVDSDRSKDFNAWNEAYSTRSNPAMLATPAMVNASQWSKSGDNDCFWGSYMPPPDKLQEATDESVMLKFYGLKKVDGEEQLQMALPSGNLEEDIRTLGNTYVGANPSRAIISGAALCTGPGTTLDFPPYIHADLNIMWIDDHLLDKTVQEVMDTKRHPRPEGGGQAKVVKARAQPMNIAKYTLEIYMPTLMYGVLMDVWMNREQDYYLLKYNPEDLPSNLLTRRAAMTPSATPHEAMGTFTQAMHTVRLAGKMLEGQALGKFKASLWADALERIKDTYYQWTQMPEPEIEGKATPTFASLWISGRVCAHPGLERYCESESCSKLARGVVSQDWDGKAKDAKSHADLPEITKSDIQEAMRENIDQLVQTACTQLEWILQWPDVVQALRAENQGSLATDLSWLDVQ